MDRVCFGSSLTNRTDLEIGLHCGFCLVHDLTLPQTRQN
jgi:hypothetical protein